MNTDFECRQQEGHIFSVEPGLDPEQGKGCQEEEGSDQRSQQVVEVTEPKQSQKVMHELVAFATTAVSVTMGRSHANGKTRDEHCLLLMINDCTSRRRMALLPVAQIKASLISSSSSDHLSNNCDRKFTSVARAPTAAAAGLAADILSFRFEEEILLH